ncbi:MAG: hypothetical protein JRI23_07605 [Deltaproteobacteria bacterium]|jgi:hypothetical protein|nr:hypothetical protein [Deltaproteobacteria bacterium]MBW2531470.1 hypothetical protein [Deltaproteobacteria bacterium]
MTKHILGTRAAARIHILMLAASGLGAGCDPTRSAPSPTDAPLGERPILPLGDTATTPSGEGSGEPDDGARRFERAPLDSYRELGLTLGGGCALHKSGRLACWGRDTLGLDRGFARSKQPRFVPGLPPLSHLAGGGLCVSASDARTWCWGLGAWTATGRPEQFSYLPVRAPHLDGLRIFIARPLDGRHGCGLAANGDLSCWGANGAGQTGQAAGVGDFGAYRPAAVVAHGVKAVAAGGRHTCATDDRGALRCWGDAEGGALGDGDAHERDCEWYTPDSPAGGPPPARARRCKGPDPFVATPLEVSAGPVTALAAGWRSACAVDRGQLSCWGDRFGPSPRLVPVADVAQLAAAGSLYCGRSEAGEVSCWGAEPSGRLVSMTPRAIEPLRGATTIAVAPARVCGLVRGTVRCWGRNESGLTIDDFTNAGPQP